MPVQSPARRAAPFALERPKRSVSLGRKKGRDHECDMPPENTPIILISGSLRARSASTAAIAAAAELAPANVAPAIYAELDRLPHFNPDHDRDPLADAVVRLRDLLGRARAVMLSTPEYAGSLPGSFKNMIDWT